MKPKISVVAATMAVAGASLASASSVDVSFLSITKNSSSDLKSQLKLTVSDVPGQPSKVDFSFRNLVGITSSVKDVFFDAGTPGAFFSGGMIYSQKGSSFSWGAGGGSGDLPGGNNLSPAFSPTLNFRASTGSSDATSGLDQLADMLVIRLTLANDRTFSDVVGALINSPLKPGAIRIGLAVEAIGSTALTDSYVSDRLVVPLPPAAWGGLGCLAAVIGAGVFRSRRLAQRD